MRSELLRIFLGEIYATADGEEFSIIDLDAKTGYALIESSDGREGLMGIANMLSAIQGGGLVSVGDERRSSETASEDDR